MARFERHPYAPRDVADWLLESLDRARETRGRASLAIAGGRSVGAVIEEIARRIDARTRVALALLWVDERAVPEGHPDRNDAAGIAAWRAGGELPAQVLPMPFDVDPDRGVESYSDVLFATAAGGTLDAVLLGLGEDGHLASLFPHRPELAAPGPVLHVANSPKPPPRRWTLALDVLSAARRRAVLALGAAKAEACRRADDPPSPGLPASLLPADPTTRWYLDEDARRRFES